MNKWPNDRFYHQDSWWIKVEDDIAVLGINHLASQKTKEFIFIDLPEINQLIKKGERLISLEALKWSGHLSSPLTGKIIKVNEEVYQEPKIINDDPYQQGWLCYLEFTNKEELLELLSAEEMMANN